MNSPVWRQGLFYNDMSRSLLLDASIRGGGSFVICFEKHYGFHAPFYPTGELYTKKDWKDVNDNVKKFMRAKRRIDRGIDCSDNGDTWVYVIKDDTTGHHKIGFSKNPARRASEFSSPIHGTTTLHCFRGGRIEEKILHDFYKRKRIDGEWFDLQQDDIEYIKKNFK